MSEQKNLLIVLGEWMEQRRSARQSAERSRGGRCASGLRWLIPNGGTLLLVLILALTANVWAEPLLGTANVPGPSANTVNYQGRLANDAGTPLDGSYGMSFALYDAPTAGNLVWGPESHAAVPVSDGLFSVGLGSQTSGGIPTSVWNGDVYLEMTVSGETLEPREIIRSVPIAGMALTVPDGAIETGMIAENAVSRIMRVEPSTQDVSTDSASWVELPEMSTTFTVEEGGSNVLVLFSGTFINDTPGCGGAVGIEVDGQFYESTVSFGHSDSSSDAFTLATSYGTDLDPGVHTVTVLWRRQLVSPGGNLVAQRLHRQLTIVELRR
jgi:hypothetical protein